MRECTILGVNIGATNMNEVIKSIQSDLKNIKGKYICVSNVHTLVMSYEDEVYKNVQNNALFRLPDGAPLSKISKKMGYEKSERVTGPDLMEEIFQISEINGYRHYFYGSTNETLEALKNELLNKYPNMEITGMYSPPFREISIEEDKSIINMINSTNSDFIWIGLGAPKQELWMANHKNKINGLMIGVGAGFDYHAKKIKRAPMIFQKLCLEWMYRLIQEPRRLFRRYAITNYKFIKYYIKEKTLKGRTKNEGLNS